MAEPLIEVDEDLHLPGLDASTSTGVYRRLAHPALSLPEYTDRPFRYRHLGSLAYIGGETAAIDLGAAGTFTGVTAFWLWKSAYLNEAVSTRTRLNLAFDWSHHLTHTHLHKPQQRPRARVSVVYRFD